MKKLGNKLKLFFDTLTKSLTNFDFYKDINKAKFSFSLKYLSFLFYLLALITSIVIADQIAISLLPVVPGFIKDFKTKANSFYPQNLVVTIKNGEISTNVKEPYIIDIQGINLTKNSHLITIDTKADIANFKSYNTGALITKDSVIVATDSTSSSYRVYPINKTSNTIIDKNAYNNLLSKILPYLKYITPALIVLIILLILIWPFIGTAFSLIFELIYLAIFSLVFFLVVKLMKKNLSFTKLYQLTMHAASLPILLGFVIASLGIVMPPLLGTAILFIFMILVVNQF